MLNKQEDLLMAKHGLEFSNFAAEDWRDIFDLYTHLTIDRVKKYIAPIKINDFYRELYDLQSKKNKVYAKYEELLELVGEQQESDFGRNLYDSLMEL